MCMSAMAPPLCKASLEDQETRQNLRFQRFPLVSQPVSKPLPEKFPDFLPRDSPSYEELRVDAAALAWRWRRL